MRLAKDEDPDFLPLVFEACAGQHVVDWERPEARKAIQEIRDPL